MEKFKELISLCKCSVSIHVNDHKDAYYESVKDYISDEDAEDIEPEVYAKMVELNTCVEIYAYPTTPIGSYKIYHYDVDLAVEKMLEIIKKEKQ